MKSLESLHKLVKENSVLEKSKKDLESGFDEKLKNYGNKVAMEKKILEEKYKDKCSTEPKELKKIEQEYEKYQDLYWKANQTNEQLANENSDLKSQLNEFNAKCTCTNGYLFEDTQVIKKEVKRENFNRISKL